MNVEPISVRRQGFIDREKALPAIRGGIATAMARQLGALAIAFALAIAAYASYVALGMLQAPAVSGVARTMPIDAPVSILRDARGVPHIRATTAHDLFFAQGYAEASDRLFQLDLMRRFIYGELAEILGPLQLPLDEQNRYLDAADIAARQWNALGKRERNVLQAFSDGVNAAMRAQPLPLEFRLLLYAPRAWTPRDSLAILLAAGASVSDWPTDVLARDRLWRQLGPAKYAQYYPLSDGNYDTVRTRIPGSNAWAAGAALTRSGRALLANDPHLDTYLPSVWYLVELRGPDFHAAGASIPGVPGVMLGHNEHLAWGATNALVTTLTLFRARLSPRYWKRETFAVRFGKSAVEPYYRSPEGFGFGNAAGGKRGVLVRWQPFFDARSPFTTILALDAARNVNAALHVLSTYGGPPQNFVFADDRGLVAYHLAGVIPNDPAWGRYVHADVSSIRTIAPLPYRKLPAIPASNNGVVITANNKMYAAGYPYRLSAAFAPPYRAFRIAHLLATRKRYDIAYFTRMQMDAFSGIDLEFARRLAAFARVHPGLLPSSAVTALETWDGTFAGPSKTATLVHELRTIVIDRSEAPYRALADLRGGKLSHQTADDIRAAVDADWRHAIAPWSSAGAISVAHPLGLLRIPFLRGYTLAGLGDDQTLHVQTPGFAQSFRAVWKAGDWDAGGIVIPGGESGSAASGHYTDQIASWRDGRLPSLPFSARAVRAAARQRLLLLPAVK